jgi:hypothetical protein
MFPREPVVVIFMVLKSELVVLAEHGLLVRAYSKRVSCQRIVAASSKAEMMDYPSAGEPKMCL